MYHFKKDEERDLVLFLALVIARPRYILSCLIFSAFKFLSKVPCYFL